MVPSASRPEFPRTLGFTQAHTRHGPGNPSQHRGQTPEPPAGFYFCFSSTRFIPAVNSAADTRMPPPNRITGIII